MGLVPLDEDRIRARGSMMALGPLDEERSRPRLSSVGLVTDDRPRKRGSLIGDDERMRPPRGSTPAEERRVYSPVTFQDIARRSTGNSPVKTSAVAKGLNF